MWDIQRNSRVTGSHLPSQFNSKRQQNSQGLHWKTHWQIPRHLFVSNDAPSGFHADSLATESRFPRELQAPRPLSLSSPWKAAWPVLIAFFQCLLRPYCRFSCYKLVEEREHHAVVLGTWNARTSPWNNQNTAATYSECNTCYRKVMCKPWKFEDNSQHFQWQLRSHVPPTNQALHTSIKLISQQELNLELALKKALGKNTLTLKLPRKEEPNPFLSWLNKARKSVWEL